MVWEACNANFTHTHTHMRTIFQEPFSQSQLSAYMYAASQRLTTLSLLGGVGLGLFSSIFQQLLEHRNHTHSRLDPHQGPQSLELDQRCLLAIMCLLLQDCNGTRKCINGLTSVGGIIIRLLIFVDLGGCLDVTIPHGDVLLVYFSMSRQSARCRTF